MNKETVQAMRDHAIADYPREACGLVIADGRKEIYVRCRNMASNDADGHSMSFLMDPENYSAAQEQGPIVALVHSHPDQSADPSEGDRTSCEDMQKDGIGVPWYIVSVYREVDGQIVTGDIKGFVPEGWEAPLIGRQFSHGTLDCWRIVRDWYRIKMAMDLPDFEREDEWWNKGQNLYVDNFESAGFVRYPKDTPLKLGDVIIMQIRADRPNHAGVFVGNTLMLHHLYGYLSNEVVYGGYWQETTIFIARHRSLE